MPLVQAGVTLAGGPSDLPLVTPQDAAAAGGARSGGWPERTLTGLLAWRGILLPATAFVMVMGYFALRAFLRVVPEGDSALHLHLMETVANGELPRVVPYFAAVVDEGGEVREYFPYSYTPLYHLLGGALFKIGGQSAVLMMGPFFAGLIAVAVFYLLRTHQWPVLALALPLVFGHWLTQPIMTWVYMEPMMLAFFFGGLCFYQRTWSDNSIRAAVLAGILFGLAVATRQSGLFYVAFIAIHGLATLAFEAYRGLGRPELRTRLLAYVVMAFATAVIALPFLGYLVWSSGSIGYAGISVPLMGSSLPIDPEANSYLSSISLPAGSPLTWLDRFWEWTLFTSRWQLRPIAFLPLIPFGVGMAYLWTRQDRASKFLATYALVHLLGEIVQFLVFHGNWRYIIASRVLFYMVVAVGVWYIVAWMSRAARAGDSWNPALTGACAATLTAAALLPGFVTPGLVDFLAHQGESGADKGRAFQELGEFVERRVPEDALILSGRWYTTGWYLQRDYAWVTYYGNAWVVDAISTPNAALTRRILTDRGVDYVIVQAPPPTYVDQMPREGLRQVLLEDLDHFQLVFSNEGTRLYRFWPSGIKRQEERISRD